MPTPYGGGLDENLTLTHPSPAHLLHVVHPVPPPNLLLPCHHPFPALAVTEWAIEYYISMLPHDTVKRVLIIPACLGPEYNPQHSKYFLLYLSPLTSQIVFWILSWCFHGILHNQFIWWSLYSEYFKSVYLWEHWEEYSECSTWS